MKTIRYKRLKDLQRGKKYLSITSRTQEDDCQTWVRKRFLYRVEKAQDTDLPIEPPHVYIRKSRDSMNRIEKFSFQVIGYFYMSHDQQLLKVHFHHTLNIQINWYKKIFSPKQSAVLT